MHAPEIRPATTSDLERLVDVEVRAGQAFRTVGMTEVAEASLPGIDGSLRCAMVEPN